MEHLGITDIHVHVLDIAKEFDRICTEHNIPYYMLGGTMLGAIRHKGFIPWDDDMDFGVPIEFFEQLEGVLVQELSYPYRCCTFKNHPAVLHNYMKIEDRTTCIDDHAINLPLEQKLGLNIDVFPLIKGEPNGKDERRIRKMVKLLGLVYSDSTTRPNSKMRTIIKRFLRLLLGKTPRRMQVRVEKELMSMVNKGTCLTNVLGRWEEKEEIPMSWYGENTRYVFEDTKLVGLKEYDQYLTKLYGDYNSLPPKEHQIAHVENVYLR